MAIAAFDQSLCSSTYKQTSSSFVFILFIELDFRGRDLRWDWCCIHFGCGGIGGWFWCNEGCYQA
ncbi:hypothetical protein SDJN02_23471, partial [Cucurbita argyrosperma subsp. argyrosperma]